MILGKFEKYNKSVISAAAIDAFICRKFSISKRMNIGIWLCVHMPIFLFVYAYAYLFLYIEG